MEGCPFCSELKEMLNESKVIFHERDIHEHEDEYSMFKEITKNEFIPAFMIIEKNEENNKTYLYAPDRDFQELTEAVEIINRHNNGLL